MRFQIAFSHIFAGILVLFSAASAPGVLARFWSNLGWQAVETSMLYRKSLPEALIYFSKASAFDSANQSAYRGLGIVSAARHDESQALSYWQKVNADPTRLNQQGRQILARGEPNTAMIYFRSAASLSQEDFSEGFIEAGRLCQNTIPFSTILSLRNQHYCKTFFADQANNLLLDSQFEHTPRLGWHGTFFFSDSANATVELDGSTGRPAPSLILTGLTSGRHGGIYQRIALRPGTKVQFNGYFRTHSAGDLVAWLLYVEWQDNGKVHGASFYKVEKNMDWTYLEGTMTLPSTSEPWMNFYPALLIGRGVVWSDDVSVKIIDHE